MSDHSCSQTARISRCGRIDEKDFRRGSLGALGRGKTCRCLLIVLLLMAGCAKPQSTPYSDLIVRYTTDKPFADVVEEIEFAVSERNFRITGANKIGSALRERGYKDFPDMEVIHFCSLEYAREVLEIDPGYVAMMPCRITVHVQDGKTVISLVLLPEDHSDPRVNRFAARMNGLLREVVAFALEENAPAAPASSARRTED